MPKLRCNGCGNKTSCPLCGGPLTGTPDPDSEIFPRIPSRALPNQFILRLGAGLRWRAAPSASWINYALDSRIWWSLFVGAGRGLPMGGCGNRHFAAPRLDEEHCLADAADPHIEHSVGLGHRAGAAGRSTMCCPASAVRRSSRCVCWRGCCGFRFRPLQSRLLLACLLGLVPAVLLACGALRVVIPSLICSALSIVALCALALFFGPMLRAELHRRLHL